MAIRIVLEDRLAPVAAIHHVINRAGTLDSQLGGAMTGAWRTPLYVSISRTDPFKN